MARGDDLDKRIEELERRASIHDRELVVLADTLKELAGQVQQFAQAQMQVLESHEELLHKIVEMDTRLNDLSRQG